MVRILSRHDVEDLLSVEQATECIERAFVEQGHGQAVSWPRFLIKMDSGYVRSYAGGLGESGLVGYRYTVGSPDRAAAALLFDPVTGEALTLIAYPFSELRVAATVAVGVKWLAKPGLQKVAMIGTGRNAAGAIRATVGLLETEEVRVFSPTVEHRRDFAADLARDTGVSTIAVDDPADAVRGASTVVIMTASTSPALRGEWLDPDALVLSAGMRQEVDGDVFTRADLIVTTSKVHELNVHESRPDWPLVRLQVEGLLDWSRVQEMGSVVTGEVSRPGGITVFSEAWGGFTDVALAVWLYQRAGELGRGVEAPFW